MRANDSLSSLKNLIEENNTLFITIFSAVFLFISNFLFLEVSGLYMILILVVILVEVIVGAIFLLFNTTTAILAMFLQEGLSDPEKKWIQYKVKRNSIIIGIWLLFSGFTFVIIAPNLGVIAGVYLIALILIFKYADVEENPFLEKRYEIS